MSATHYGFFNTATSRTRVRMVLSTHDGAGANVAPDSAFEAADIRIYRAADSAAFSATQRSSSNGVTMVSPFDSLVGVHEVDIDLTDNTDSGFYASGYTYLVMLSPDETVDGETITGVVLGYFEIGLQSVDVLTVGGEEISDEGAIPANVVEYGGVAGFFSAGRPEVLSPKSIYVLHNGTDSTSGAALKAAVEAAAFGTTVYASSGIFNIGGDKITVPAGVTLEGAGIGATKVLNSGASICIQLSTRCIVQDLTIEAPSGWGTGAPSSGASFAQALLRRVYVVAGIDGFLLGQNGSSSVRIEDSTLEATEDAITILGAFGTHVATLYNVVLRVSGSFNGITIDNSQTVRGYNVSIYAPSGNGVRADGSSQLQLFDTKIYAAVSVVRTGSATVRLVDCEFDRTTASGTFTDISSSNSVRAKLPSKTYLAGSSNSDGDVQLDEATGTLAANAIAATSIATGAFTAAKFAAGAFDAVWTVAARLLTAGTNIVLAKGTGVTGFNDLSAAQVNAEVDTAIVDADLATATQVTDLGVDLGQLGQSLNEAIDDLPSAGQNADAVWDEPKAGHATANTFGAFVDSKISEVEGGGGGGGVEVPVNQVPVPPSRTWILKHTSDGLRGEMPLVRNVGEHQLFAVDFRRDLANNGRLVSIESIEVDGTDGGIVIDEEDRGVDRSEAKFVIELVEAGTYIITVSAEYDDSDGGGTSSGSVTLIVK